MAKNERTQNQSKNNAVSAQKNQSKNSVKDSETGNCKDRNKQ